MCLVEGGSHEKNHGLMALLLYKLYLLFAINCSHV